MTTTTTTPSMEPTGRSGRWLIWTAGLIVALGAAIATAHGLYEVAIAATVPGPIAWLYPLITDGLALVAYASTTRLTSGGRRYAWAVVVLAAGLSGLAQASYLAIGVHTAPAELRAGVGAWPAVAAAITAHLLYLLAAVRPATQPVRPDAVYAVRSGGVRSDAGHPVRPDATHDRLSGPTRVAGTNTADHGRQAASGPSGPIPADPWAPDPPGTDAAAVRPSDAAVRPSDAAPDTGRPARPDTVRSHVRPDAEPDTGRRSDAASDGAPDTARPGRPDTARPGEATGSPSVAAGSGSAGERARATALAYRDAHGGLPTVAALMRLADVGHGTAGEALRPLRERLGLQIVRTHQTGTSP